jgi:hypothetical protein
LGWTNVRCATGGNALEKLCQAFHEHLIEHNQLDLGQVQADEIKVKTQNGPMWMAMAIMVPKRL